MQWRRRRSLVNAKQQIWYAVELIIVGIAFVILCAFLLFVPPFNNLLGTVDLAAKVFDGLTRLLFFNWPMIVVAFVLFGLVGILLGHRIWGPLYQLDRVLGSWTNGDRKARVRFRKYDYLLPVENSLNEFLDLQQSILDGVEKRAKEIEEDLKAGHADQAAEKARNLISIAQQRKDAPLGGQTQQTLDPADAGAPAD
jgi:methyl-accepting chemotaxis protein